MAFRSFKKLGQKDYLASKLQDNSEQFNNQFRAVPFLNGVRLTDIVVTTSTISVEHKLGREPLGYLILKQNADARVWYTSINELFLVLDSSATVTIDLWVF